MTVLSPSDQQRAPAPPPAPGSSMQAVVERGLASEPERGPPHATSRAEREEKHSHPVPDNAATPLLFPSPHRQSPWRPNGPHRRPDISDVRRPTLSVRSPDPHPDTFPLAPWGPKQDRAEGGPRAVQQLQWQTPGPVLPTPPRCVPDDTQSLVSAPRCITVAPPPYLRFMAPPVFQQPIAAHRVVSSVGQQAAVGSVAVGPLYAWLIGP